LAGFRKGDKVFKRIKQIKGVIDKVTRVRNAFEDEFAKQREYQGSTGTITIIHQTSIELLQQLVKEGRQILTDDDRFMQAVDSAYDNLPLQVRIPLRKKRFRKIMLKLKEIYLSDKGNLADSVAMKIIETDMKETPEED
jgi:predicted Zn-dependent protease with MMP-like domain